MMLGENFDPKHEPPIGSVVAIGWGESRQEVWVSNKANVGNWYTTDLSLKGSYHPQWSDVVARAEGRTLTLLSAGDGNTWRAGFYAGVSAATQAATDALEEVQYNVQYRNPKTPEGKA